MFLEEITEGIKATTQIKIQYDCEGDFERCGQEWMLKYKDAQKNYDANDGRHICRQCTLRSKNPMKRKAVREKVKKTTLERHGTTCVMNTDENIAKRNEKMFGSSEVVEAIVEKRKATSRKRYGADHPMMSKEIKDKQKKALREKYGVDNPLQNSDILKRQQQTVKERYGVDNIAQLPETRAKMAKTMFERYGVEHYNELPEMKDYLREHCTEWLKESYEAGGPMKGITRPEEWNQKQSETVCSLIESGEWKGGGKNTYKGWYESAKCSKSRPMFRSGYELQVHVHLDNNDEVGFYDYEPFQVPYHDTEGKKRHYTADFIVHYKSGQLMVIEVKNSYTEKEFLDHPKHKALQALCEEHGLECEVWSNKKVKALGYKLKELLDDGRVTLYHRP